MNEVFLTFDSKDYQEIEALVSENDFLVAKNKGEKYQSSIFSPENLETVYSTLKYIIPLGGGGVALKYLNKFMELFFKKDSNRELSFTYQEKGEKKTIKIKGFSEEKTLEIYERITNKKN